jgi:competence protein ComEA
MKKFIAILAACFAFSVPAFAAVDLNTASQADLESLKGVGPAKAQAILEYRQKSGPFKSVNDLENVKGFGKKSVDALRAEVTVGSAKSEKKPQDSKKK